MSTAAALIGHTVAGRFRITSFLGEGAMATVYRGVQDAEPREVAVKVMHPELARDSTFAKRFRREAKAAARIVHRNTVQILDYGVDGKIAYIAMELLQGRDLFEILSVERRLSEARAARILIEICDVLTIAHEQGIVHRDLKPENIMLLGAKDAEGRERIKVLDFGIAKVLDKEPKEGAPADVTPPSIAPSSALTTVGVIVGTPEYMSPEQCRGEGVDARSDIYACGVLLYQLVTGHLPFLGDSIIDIALKHIRQPPPKPSNLVPFMHAPLEGVILKALEKWPAQRQQNAAELKSELERILPELRTTPLRLGGTSRDDAPPPVSRRNIAELPVDSVRHAHHTIPEQTTLQSEELTMKRKGLASPAAVDAEHDTDPSPEANRGVLIRVPCPSEPGIGSSPTIPAAPGLPTDTLATGREPPKPIVKSESPRPPPVARSKADSRHDDKAGALVPAKPRAGSRRKKGGTSFWLLVPIAVLVGITVGAVVFFLTQ